MTFAEAQLRHPSLCTEIRQHDHAYYVLAKPDISDLDYDRLLHELIDLESQFPQLVTPDSPTCRRQSKPTQPQSGISNRPPFKMPEIGADVHAMTEAELHARRSVFEAIRKKDFQQLLEDEALRLPEHTGFVYVLSNPAMPGLLKIGITSGPVQKRARQLNCATGVPEAFNVEFIIPVYEGLKAAERKAHAALELYRRYDNREFFKVPLDVARFVLEGALGQKAKPLHKEGRTRLGRNERRRRES